MKIFNPPQSIYFGLTMVILRKYVSSRLLAIFCLFRKPPTCCWVRFKIMVTRNDKPVWHQYTNSIIKRKIEQKPPYQMLSSVSTRCDSVPTYAFFFNYYQTFVYFRNLIFAYLIVALIIEMRASGVCLLNFVPFYVTKKKKIIIFCYKVQ